MCDYCDKLKSLFWCDKTEEHAIREIYVELDGSMTVSTNITDIEQSDCDSKWGYYHTQQDSCNFKINYCPMCGRKF